MRLVSLWIHPGQEGAFEAFEREAALIMERHGGRIDSAAQVTPGREADAPFEVRIVSFPNRAMAESCAADRETAGLMDRRAEIFARTFVIEGTEAGPYWC